MDRKSGVLLHISSLFGDYSIGSFGNEAKVFINFLKECGFTYWQVLPFCPTDQCNSPYKSPSAFSGNPYFISLDKLHEKRLITSYELNLSKQKTPYTCEFERLREERISLLEKASKRCSEKNEIAKFISDNPHIEAFCLFMAHKEKNDDLPWYEWTTDDYDEDKLFTWQFIQYEFFSQWKEIKDYANNMGIKIIGDIPIYVDHDSSDVWANKNLFKLDKDNFPSHVAGVPPDYFSEDGQIWGNPLYDWETMDKDNYRWWQDRINCMSDMFDGIRIDHFKGFQSYWAVPYGSPSAKNGVMLNGPGKRFIDEIKKNQNNTLIIAEDLGVITEDVIKLVDYSKFPGMRVFQFAFTGDTSSPHLPHNYVNDCIAYTGTHDNNTLLGYLWELDSETRKHMLSYCGFNGENWEQGFDCVIRTMFASHAGVLIMPIQDLLKYGSDTRLNTPGKADGNWSYRITKEQLESIDKEYFKKLNTLYGRI